MSNNKIGYKILHFPLTKIVIGMLVIGLLYGLSQTLLNLLLSTVSWSAETSNLVIGIVSSLIAIVAYFFLYKYYEKREIAELSTKRIGRNLVLGILLGAVLQSLTILVIYLMGGYTVISINPVLFIIPPLTMAFTSSIFEEILLRGIVFRIAEEKLGSYIALLISALFFGLLHVGNPNSSLIVGLSLAIQAGLLLGVSYMYARNLWLPIAIHFAWNFTQSGIYGAKVSGITVEQTLLTSNIEGATWFTGGEFGPEGSIQATLFCLIATIVLLRLCHRDGKIINPYWSK